MALRQILTWSKRLSSVQTHSNNVSGIANFSSKSSPYVVKVGIPEFLKGVGRGVENHVEKLETEIGGLQKLLVTRTLRLKRLGIPCKDKLPAIESYYGSVHHILSDYRKLILKYTHKYRLGLWRPRAQPIKS